MDSSFMNSSGKRPNKASKWILASVNDLAAMGLALLTLSLDTNMDNWPRFSNAASDWLPAELPANQKPH